MLALFDKLIDQLVDVRAADVVDGCFAPVRQDVTSQDAVDALPGLHVGDDFDLHKSLEDLEGVD